MYTWYILCVHVPKEARTGYENPWEWSHRELLERWCWDLNLGPWEMKLVL